MSIDFIQGGTPTAFPISSGGTAALGWTTVGSLADGVTMTISTDGTNPFTTKTNAKPLLWFDVNDAFGAGLIPNEDLGRKASWDGAFNGALSTSILETNSINSVKWDLGAASEAASHPALAEVDFTGGDLLMHRKVYNDFSEFNNYGLRTWVETASISGTIVAGTTATGAISGATATVHKVYPDVPANGTAVYYETDQGSVQQPSPTDFEQNETINFSNGASAKNIEPFGSPAGVYRGFNAKMLRVHDAEFGSHSIYTGSNPYAGSVTAPNDGTYTLSLEGSDSTQRDSLGDYQNAQVEIAEQWHTDTLEVQAGTVDTSDGKVHYSMDGVIGTPRSDSYILKTASNDSDHDSVVQSQVSNGCLNNSNQYYDHLYIDDTWHRVIFTDSSTWNEDVATNIEIQIPLTWDGPGDEITVQVRQGRFTTWTGVYLYVIDSTGIPVTTTGVAVF